MKEVVENKQRYCHQLPDTGGTHFQNAADSVKATCQ